MGTEVVKMDNNRTNRKPTPKLPEDSTSTLGIRCYDEQCIEGMDKTLKAVMNLDRSKYEAYAIVHNKGTKKHLHVAIRTLGKGTERVKKLLMLLKIHFRPEDESIMLNRGLETLGTFKGYLKYLTHTDTNSINAGKPFYELSEFCTNMDRIKFVSLIDFNPPRSKLTKDEMLALYCEAADKAGYELQNRNKWMDSQDLEFTRLGFRNTQRIKIKDYFRKGQKRRIDEIGYIPQLVICLNVSNDKVFSPNDVYKIIKQALKDLNINVIHNGEDIETADVDTAIIRHLNGTNMRGYSIREGWHTLGTIDYNQRISINKYLNYTNSVSVISDEDAVEAWTYNILIIEGDSKGKINRVNDKTFYYCSIDEDDRSLDLKEVFTKRKGETEKEERDRIDLWIKFRDAFNRQLKDYKKPQVKEKEPPAKVDYSKILGKGTVQENPKE